MTFEEALYTLYATKKYLLPVLEDGCRRILEEDMRKQPETFWEIIILCFKNPDDKLLKTCHDFLSENIVKVEAVLKSLHFLDIPKEILFHVLKLNDIEANLAAGNDTRHILISEIKLFQACDAWAKAECTRQEIPPTGLNKRMVLGDCLFLIRFPAMLVKDLVNIVFPTEILTQEEKYSLLQYAYSDNQDGMTLNFKAKPPTFCIELETPFSRPLVEENYPFQRGQVKYSTIEILPRERLGISGILLFPDYEMPEEAFPAPSLHEVIIAKNCKEKVICKFIMSKVILGDPSIHVLEFEELCLEPQATYLIKVEMAIEMTEDEDDIDDNRHEDFYFKLLAPSQVRLEVTKNSENYRLTGLRMRPL